MEKNNLKFEEKRLTDLRDILISDYNFNPENTELIFVSEILIRLFGTYLKHKNENY